MAKPQVRDSIRQTGVDSWIVLDRFSIIRTRRESSGCWSDGSGSFFAASEGVESGLETETGKHPFVKVYDVGNKHVAWQVGEAFLKIVDLEPLSATREHITLEFLREMTLDFLIPEVLFHGEWDGRYCLITSRVPGRTINELWPKMEEADQARLVKRISGVCTTLAGMEPPKTCDGPSGVDGRDLPDWYMASPGATKDFDSSRLLRNCREIGMDCSTLVFYHCDLGPTNILFDEATGRLSVIDWECAGFVPREWIRTKFRICGGMDLDDDETKDPSARRLYRKRVADQLEKDGFHDCAMNWMRWQGLA